MVSNFKNTYFHSFLEVRILLVFILYLYGNAFLWSQDYSNNIYTESIRHGKAAFDNKEHNYCTMHFKNASKIGPLSFSNSLRASVCAYHSGDSSYLAQELANAFRLEGEKAKQLFYNNPEFGYLKSTTFEDMAKEAYEKFGVVQETSADTLVTSINNQEIPYVEIQDSKDVIQSDDTIFIESELNKLSITRSASDDIDNIPVIPKTLSLSEAIEIGINNNNQIRIAKYRYGMASSNVNFGDPDRLPQVDVYLREDNRWRADNSPTSFVDGVYSRSDLSAGLDARWMIYAGGRVKVNRSILKELERLTDSELEIIIQNTVQNIILTYYECLIEKEKLKIFEETLKLSNEKANNSKLLYEYGELAKHQLFDLTNASIQDSISVSNQNLLYNQAIIRLQHLIPLQTYTDMELTDSLQYSSRLDKYEFLKERMLSRNPDLYLDIINSAIAKKETNLVESVASPSIELRGGLSQELGTSKFTSEERERSSLFDTYLSLAVRYNVFDGRRTKRQVEMARIEEEIAMIAIDDKKIKLEEMLRFNYSEINQGLEILSKQDALINNLNSNLDIYKERFSGGYSIFIEYRTAQLQLLEAKLERLKIIYNLKLAETELLRLTGDLFEFF